MEQLEYIYKAVVNATVQASGIPLSRLMNSRADQCVTARVVLIDVLLQLDMAETDIVTCSGMSQQRVNSLKNSRKYRMKSLGARILKEEVLASIANYQTIGEGFAPLRL
jgi:hypothetical protein